MVDSREPTLRPRSRAWLLGWLSLVGPVGVVASLALGQLLGEPQLYVGALLSGMASIVTCILGIVAVRRGIRDGRRHAAERPRLIGGGIALGVVGAVGSGLVALVIGLFLLALSQYRWA
ncbi:hypothetical protein ABID70_002389 [Clavibacter michiganensis]|uniref:hypothetical protein n=1 Tax=Clavibacter michiganensis TaxID=28447 RepID=UPI001AE13EEF|nr:hypothetical protein [Clavibacter michiganensis]MBP2456865.1 hypothetical protein [Clavibacter michiganensis]MDQ0409435.1 hypothetical protein [Clavibacter michiganensis]